MVTEAKQKTIVLKTIEAIKDNCNINNNQSIAGINKLLKHNKKENMTTSELKYNVELTGSFFFTRQTMRFFGDIMRNYGIRSATIEGIEAWELYRRQAVKHGLIDSTYFDKQTFKRVYPKTL